MHVIRAFQKWTVGVKRGQVHVHRRLVNQFRRMMMHVEFHTSDGWKITKAIVQAGLLQYICSEKFIPCDPWDEESVFIQEKSNRDEMKRSEVISAASLPTSDQIEKLEQEISY
jgi:hypothetical protein